MFPRLQENERAETTEPETISIVVTDAENDPLTPWSNTSKSGPDENWVAIFPEAGSNIYILNRILCYGITLSL